MDAAVRRRLHVVVVRGLAAAAEALAGDDPGAVCATLRGWRERDQRELPWLAGPGLSAIRSTGVTVSAGGALKTVERFLVGAETDAQVVEDAIHRCVAEAGDPGSPMPPDAVGALADAVDRFFDLLAAAYAQIHQPVRTGHRRDAEDLIVLWQGRLDEAADVVEDRAKVVTGERVVAPGRPKPPRGSRDRPGCAVVFVVLALVAAGVMVWAVLHGWPAEPVVLP